MVILVSSVTVCFSNSTTFIKLSTMKVSQSPNFKRLVYPQRSDCQATPAPSAYATLISTKLFCENVDTYAPSSLISVSWPGIPPCKRQSHNSNRNLNKSAYNICDPIRSQSLSSRFYLTKHVNLHRDLRLRNLPGRVGISSGIVERRFLGNVMYFLSNLNSCVAWSLYDISILHVDYRSSYPLSSRSLREAATTVDSTVEGCISSSFTSLGIVYVA